MIQCFGSLRSAQLDAVTAGELVEDGRVVAVPPAQFGGWRDLLAPFVEISVRFRQATGPDAVDQYPTAVSADSHVVDPTHLHVGVRHESRPLGSEVTSKPARCAAATVEACGSCGGATGSQAWVSSRILTATYTCGDRVLDLHAARRKNVCHDGTRCVFVRDWKCSAPGLSGPLHLSSLRCSRMIARPDVIARLFRRPECGADVTGQLLRCAGMPVDGPGEASVLAHVEA